MAKFNKEGKDIHIDLEATIELGKDVYAEDVVLGPCRRCGKMYVSSVDDGMCNACWEELDANSGWSY